MRVHALRRQNLICLNIYTSIEKNALASWETDKVLDKKKLLDLFHLSESKIYRFTRVTVIITI